MLRNGTGPKARDSRSGVRVSVSGKAKMRGLSQRMKYRVGDQLLWSSVPLFLLSLVIVGVCTWILVSDRVVHTELARCYIALGLVVGVSVLVITLVGIMRVIRLASRRLYALGDAMRDVARGDLDRRLEITCRDEVGTLISYFNNMADDLSRHRNLADQRAAQLRSSLDDLKRLDKAKQEFLTLVSHEVRTPLTAIKGGVEYLRSSIRDVSAAENEIFEGHNLPEILNIIDKNMQRLGGFMNDATVMANIQSMHKRMTITQAPARDLIQDILSSHAEAIAEKKLEVRHELPPGCPWELLGDMEMLYLALEKVVNNAVAHNVPGGLVVIREVFGVPDAGGPEDLRARVDAAAGELFPDGRWHDHAVRWRLIEIYNTGKPIPEDRQEALFTVFELVGPIENHQRSTGLSMPIVKTALERHGGGVFVLAREGGGNSFFLLVPTLDQGDGISGRPESNLWSEVGQGFGGIPGYEEVDPRGQGAGCEVEFADLGAVTVGQVCQTGRGVDQTSSADHQ